MAAAPPSGLVQGTDEYSLVNAKGAYLFSSDRPEGMNAKGQTNMISTSTKKPLQAKQGNMKRAMKALFSHVKTVSEAKGKKRKADVSTSKLFTDWNTANPVNLNYFWSFDNRYRLVATNDGQFFYNLLTGAIGRRPVDGQDNQTVFNQVSKLVIGYDRWSKNEPISANDLTHYGYAGEFLKEVGEGKWQMNVKSLVGHNYLKYLAMKKTKASSTFGRLIHDLGFLERLSKYVTTQTYNTYGKGNVVVTRTGRKRSKSPGGKRSSVTKDQSFQNFLNDYKNIGTGRIVIQKLLKGGQLSYKKNAGDRNKQKNGDGYRSPIQGFVVMAKYSNADPAAQTASFEAYRQAMDYLVQFGGLDPQMRNNLIANLKKDGGYVKNQASNAPPAFSGQQPTQQQQAPPGFNFGTGTGTAAPGFGQATQGFQQPTQGFQQPTGGFQGQATQGTDISGRNFPTGGNGQPTGGFPGVNQ